MSGDLLDDFLYFNESKKSNVIGNVIYLALIIFCVFLVICVNVFSFSEVSGDSMMNTVFSNDIVVCVRPKEIDRGDIVTATVNREKAIIKRVIAVGGDKIVFRTVGDAKSPFVEAVEIYLDSGDGFELVEETYLYDGVMTEKGFVGQEKFSRREYGLYAGDIAQVPEEYVITVKDGEYFLLGDNRDKSMDSRNYGTFSEEKISGKVVKIVEAGSAFYRFLNFILVIKGKSESLTNG